MKRPDKKPAGSTPAQIAERRSLNRLITDWITKLRIKASIYYNRNRYKTIAPTIVLLACLLLVHYGAKTVHSAFHVTVGRDARTFYYGSRLLLHGKNPYDDAQMVAVWAQDHAPATYKPGLPSEVFVYPPVMALLFTPAAFLPWQQGTTAVVLLNLLGAGATVVLLCMGARRRWSFEWYPAFACYALLLPATRLVITYGQSTFVICTCLAASLYALSRKWDGLGGLLLGLSLAKFTLTFPFLALLAFRRQWKPVAVALGSFCVINAILAAPIGILNAFEGFFHLVSVTTAPESVNDAFSASFRASVIVNLDRCFFLVYPDDRQIASGASRLVSLIAIVCLGYLFRRSKQTRSFVNPLEISVATLAGLTLFYHRDYDLATLMFVAYGLLEYRLQHPERCLRSWKVSMALLILLSYAPFQVWPFPWFEHPVPPYGVPSFRFNMCILVAALATSLLWLLYEDQNVPPGATPKSGGLTNQAPARVSVPIPASSKKLRRRRPKSA